MFVLTKFGVQSIRTILSHPVLLRHKQFSSLATPSLSTYSETGRSLTKILERPMYGHLYQTLKKDVTGSPIDIAGERRIKLLSLVFSLCFSAKFVLRENIKVPIEALDCEQNFYTNFLDVVSKRNLGPDFPLKVGSWAKTDVALVSDNLRRLQQSAGLSEEELQQIFFRMKSAEDAEQQKKNLVGYWCSQGLSLARDPCEVFQKLRLILTREAERGGRSQTLKKQELTNILQSQEYKLMYSKLQKSSRRKRTALDVTGLINTYVMYNSVY